MPASLLNPGALPGLDGLPEASRKLIATAAAADEARRRKEHESRSRQAEEIAERARAAKVKLIGPANARALRAELTREKAAFRKRLPPPSGLTLD